MLESHNLSLQESLAFQKETYNKMFAEFNSMKDKYHTVKEKYETIKEIKERQDGKLEMLIKENTRIQALVMKPHSVDDLQYAA